MFDDIIIQKPFEKGIIIPTDEKLEKKKKKTEKIKLASIDDDGNITEEEIEIETMDWDDMIRDDIFSEDDEEELELDKIDWKKVLKPIIY